MASCTCSTFRTTTSCHTLQAPRNSAAKNTTSSTSRRELALQHSTFSLSSSSLKAVVELPKRHTLVRRHSQCSCPQASTLSDTARAMGVYSELRNGSSVATLDVDSKKLGVDGTQRVAGDLESEARPFEILDEQYLKPVVGPSAWYGSEFKGKGAEARWIHVLTQEEIAEIDKAIESVKKSGKETKEVTQKDFPLPTLGPKLLAIRDELVSGRGFYLIKGLPVRKWTREEAILAYWGLGTYWGRAVSQNGKGHLIGHVKDLGTDPNNIVNRVYTHHGPQPWHCDSSDLVGLLCLNTAKEGGYSSWASSHTVYNELLKSRPDIVKVFSQPWFIDRKNEIPTGKKPYYVMPVFNYHQGRLTIHYENSFFQAAQRHPGVPKLSPAQLEAIAEFDRIASSNSVKIDYWLEVGDLQILNNHQTVHTRTGYTDWGPGPDEKRHLLRLWLSPPNERPIHPVYVERYGSVEVGARGGIRVPGSETKIPLEAE